MDRSTIRINTKLLSFALALNLGAADVHIERVAVLPIFWETETLRADRWSDLRQDWQIAVTGVLTESGRFRLANQEFFSQVWQNEESRKEAVARYEVDTLFSALFTSLADRVSMHVRLLDPNMQILLEEVHTSRLPDWLKTTPQERRQVAREVIFRLINRLPTDTRVSSVKGIYVTLNAGRQRTLHVGQELTVVRATVAQQHPVDGSWLKFDSQVLGTVKVTDVNEMTAVARIVDQITPSAIKVGAGARIASISSRQFFKKPAPPSGANEVSKPRLIVIKPTPPPQEESAKIEVQPIATNQEIPTSPFVKDEVDAPSGEKPVAKSLPEEPESDGWLGMIADTSDLVRVQAIVHKWSIAGTESAIAPWLVSHISADLESKIDDFLSISYGPALMFGNTVNGSFFGLDAHGRLVAVIPELNSPDGINPFGAFGLKLTSLNVSSENFGGFDFLRSEISVGAKLNTPNAQYMAEIGFVPVGLGQIGIAGGKAGIKSAQGFFLHSEVWFPSEEYSWGAGLSYETISLKTGENTSWSDLSLRALWRMEI